MSARLWPARWLNEGTVRRAPPPWLFTAGIVAVGLVTIGLRAFHGEAVTYTGPRLAITGSAVTSGIAGLNDAEFRLDGTARIRGWYAQGSRRATIVMLHGSTANREQILPEARVLARAGFGVLVYDSPGQGQSEGRVQCGASERRALEAAIDWVERRGDTDRERLGVFGFSLGGYIALQVAARDARVRAVAVAGAVSDWKRVTGWEYRRWGVVSEWPAMLADRVFGGPAEELEPRDLVARIAPRPLLLVQGGADTTVPGFSADELYGAAGANKERYTIPRADHGEYMHVAPTEYAHRLVDFFTRSLRASR